jgi:hypothetical protein
MRISVVVRNQEAAPGNVRSHGYMDQTVRPYYHVISQITWKPWFKYSFAKSQPYVFLTFWRNTGRAIAAAIIERRSLVGNEAELGTWKWFCTSHDTLL